MICGPVFSDTDTFDTGFAIVVNAENNLTDQKADSQGSAIRPCQY